jgi:hypothetical protein
MTSIIVIPLFKDSPNAISHQNHGKDKDMKRLFTIGIIIVLFLLNITLVSAGTIADMKVPLSQEFPTVAILIAFLIGIISAIIFIAGTHKN